MRKILLALLALFVVLFAAYTGYWFWQAGQARESARQWIDALNASAPAALQGQKLLTAEAIETTGYPASMQLVLVNPVWNMPILLPEDAPEMDLVWIARGELDGELRLGTAAPLNRIDASLRGDLKYSSVINGQEVKPMLASFDEPVSCDLRFDAAALAQRYSLDMQAMLNGLIEHPENLRNLDCSLPATEVTSPEGERLLISQGGMLEIDYDPDAQSMEMAIRSQLQPWRATPALDSQLAELSKTLTAAGMPMYFAPVAPLGDQDFELAASLRGPADMAEPIGDQVVEAEIETFTARNALTAMQLTGAFSNRPQEGGGRVHALNWKYAGNFTPAYDAYARSSLINHMQALQAQMEQSAKTGDAAAPEGELAGPLKDVLAGDAEHWGEILPELSGVSPISSTGEIAWTTVPSPQPEAMADSIELKIENTAITTDKWQLQLAAEGSMGGNKLIPEAKATLVCKDCDALLDGAQQYASGIASVYAPPGEDGTLSHPVQSIAFWRDLRGLLDAIAGAHPQTKDNTYYFQLILQGLAPTVNGLTADRLMLHYQQRLQPYFN